MTRGRKPKPTHLKLVTANQIKKPRGVKMQREATPAPFLPEPPDHLLPEAQDEWVRVSQELYHLGLLTRADRAALAAYCQCYAVWRQAWAAIRKMAEKDPLSKGLMIKTTGGNAIQNPLLGTANKAAADMVRYAAEFGMTPSARSRINAEPPEQTADPAEAYFA